MSTGTTTPGRWQYEAVNLDGQRSWGVFDGEQRPEFANQYVVLGLDEEQAKLATLILDYQGLGDPDTRDREELRALLEYHLDYEACHRCGTEHPRIAMRNLVCRECQP